MSLYSYQIFETVVQQGSFAKTADLLYLTPSAISHIISKLEKELNVQFFVRSKTGVKLTANGEQLLPYITDLLRAKEKLSQKVAQIHGLESGVVRIGTFNSVTVQWLPPIIHAFHAMHPNIEISVQQGGYEDVITWLNHDVVDLGFTSTTILGELKLKNAEVTPLYQDRMVCVVPEEFQPAHSDYVTVEDIKDYPLVMQQEAYDQESVRILNKYDLTTRSMFKIAEDDGIIAMVSAGFGVYIMPELVVKGCRGAFKYYPFYPEEYRTICLAVSKANIAAPAVVAMRREIQNFVSQLR